jgi:hypothetical protein
VTNAELELSVPKEPISGEASRIVVEMVKNWFDGKLDIPPPPEHCELNVAGSRESKACGIQQTVMAFMVDIIGAVNDLCFYPLNDEG